MSEQKIDSREFVSEKEFCSLLYDQPGSFRDGAEAIVSLVLTRARDKWGAHGRRVEGCMRKNGGFAPNHDPSLCDDPIAVLFIHEPPKPERSAEERIKEALAHYSTRSKETFDVAAEMSRILRGDGGE